MLSRHRCVAPCVALLCPLVALAGWGGPLNPPAGPIAPTAKPLAEVEPRTAINATNTPGDADSVFRITQQGSYYLAAPILGVAGKRGIEINASGVTIDLMGFAVQGVFGSLDGIATAGGARNNITIRNGLVQSWGGDGIDLVAAGVGSGATIEGVRASNNDGSGIVASLHATVRWCSAGNNALWGLEAREGAIIEQCTSRDNIGAGFVVGPRSAISGCVAIGNVGGISTTDSVLTGCQASGNGAYGFNLSFCKVVACHAETNTGAGFNCGSFSSVISCSSVSNAGTSFDCNEGCLVESCVSGSTTASGIECDHDCIIRNNIAHECGIGAGTGAGIHAIGDANRIEGNKCSGSDKGIDIDGVHNIVIRNVCSGNTTNWNIVANNYAGPVINRVGVATAAIVGDSAASSLGSTDANANYTH